MTKPDCEKCQGSGKIAKDISYLGDAGGWNPGVITVRCECNPASPEEIEKFNTVMRELGIDLKI